MTDQSEALRIQPQRAEAAVEQQRGTQRDEREQRYLRRIQRAEKYEDIERHLRKGGVDPGTVLQIERCYKTIINRASFNRENVRELW